MKIRMCLLLAFCVCIFAQQWFPTVAQSQNFHQLSYGSDVLPAYRPPTTSTVEPPTTKSSFFGGIKNWFRKTPTTEAAAETTTTTTARSVVGENVQSTTAQRESTPSTSSTTASLPTRNVGQPSLPTNNDRRDYANPNLPSSSSSKPSTPSIVFPESIPTQITSGGRRDYVNPNSPSSTPSANKPSTPAIVPPLQPSSPQPTPTQTTSGGRRDYVNLNKPDTPKVEFPQLPAPRRPVHEEFPALPSRPASSTPASTGTTSQSVWNNRPNVPSSPTTGGTTAQSAWSNRPTQISSSSSGTSSNSDPTRVSFIPTTPRPGSARPSATSETPQGQQSSNQLATDDEITTLTENLITKDVNNLNKFMTVNFQGRTKSYELTDDAPNPLLQIDSKAFDVPTVAKMKLLFNNYELDSSINEYVTPIEKREENDFIDAVMGTSVMRQAMLFLQNKGIVTPDPKTHRDLLKTIWFTLYSRGGGRIGSSGFEHIFMSEVKNGTITGLHNSLYFNEEEQHGNIDYKGYIRKLDLGNKGSIAKFRFTFNGISKPVNALFIGTSPELEMALYTVCFELRPDKDCPVSLNGNRFNLRTYTFRYRGKRLIGSGFPEI